MYVFTVYKYSFPDSQSVMSRLGYDVINVINKRVTHVKCSFRSLKDFITLIFLQSLYENEHGRWITS
jgi:hypothetical protein